MGSENPFPTPASKINSTSRLVIVLLVLIGVVILISKMAGSGDGATSVTTYAASPNTSTAKDPAAKVPMIIEYAPVTPSKGEDAATKESGLSELNEQTLQDAIEQSLGESNRDAKRVELVNYDAETKTLVVKYSLNDNFFGEDMVLLGGWDDNAIIIEAINSTKIPVSDLVTIGTLEHMDNLGNSVGEKSVFVVGFDKRAIKYVNLENLPGGMLASAAYLVDGPLVPRGERKGF